MQFVFVKTQGYNVLNLLAQWKVNQRPQWFVLRLEHVRVPGISSTIHFFAVLLLKMHERLKRGSIYLIFWVFLNKYNNYSQLQRGKWWRQLSDRWKMGDISARSLLFLSVVTLPLILGNISGSSSPIKRSKFFFL